MYTWTGESDLGPKSDQEMRRESESRIPVEREQAAQTGRVKELETKR